MCVCEWRDVSTPKNKSKNQNQKQVTQHQNNTIGLRFFPLGLFTRPYNETRIFNCFGISVGGGWWGFCVVNATKGNKTQTL